MSNLSQIKQRKLAVAGYKNVGKTALARQFTEQGYPEGYFPTIENTYKKEFIYRGNTYVADIVDTAGQVFCKKHENSQYIGHTNSICTTYFDF
jgi:small GTP-binding protein